MALPLQLMNPTLGSGATQHIDLIFHGPIIYKILGYSLKCLLFVIFSINHFYLIFDYMLLMFLASVTFVYGCYGNYFLKIKCSVLTFVY